MHKCRVINTFNPNTAFNYKLLWRTFKNDIEFTNCIIPNFKTFVCYFVTLLFFFLSFVRLCVFTCDCIDESTIKRLEKAKEKKTKLLDVLPYSTQCVYLQCVYFHSLRSMVCLLRSNCTKTYTPPKDYVFPKALNIPQFDINDVCEM